MVVASPSLPPCDKASSSLTASHPSPSIGTSHVATHPAVRGSLSRSRSRLFEVPPSPPSETIPVARVPLAEVLPPVPAAEILTHVPPAEVLPPCVSRRSNSPLSPRVAAFLEDLHRQGEARY